MSLSKRLRFLVLNRDGFKCRYCGRGAPAVELHVDHCIPSSLGGPDEAWNLRASCADCNLGKSTALLSDGLPSSADFLGLVLSVLAHADVVGRERLTARVREMAEQYPRLDEFWGELWRLLGGLDYDQREREKAVDALTRGDAS